MCYCCSKFRDGNIYLSDSRNHRIRKIDKRGIISTIVGCGESGYSGDGGLAIKAKLNAPCGICLSNDGKFLFIADRENYVIRKVSLLNGIIETIAGNGKKGGQISHGSLAIKSQISDCLGIAISKDDEL